MTILTEEQAKEKWCPFVRIEIDAFGSGIAPIKRDDPRNVCIASQCMAWRWIDGEFMKRSYLVSTGEPPEPNRAYMKSDIRTEHEPNEKRRGYCGLAAQVRP